MREDVVDNQPVISMTEEGEGRYSGYDDTVRWRTETRWSRGETFRPLRVAKTFTDANGTVLTREHTEFDSRNNVVRFEREDLRSGTSRVDTRPMPSDTLSVEGIAAALRTIPFEDDASISAHLFTPAPEMYEVTFEIRGRETVDSAGRRVECYKIELVPRLGIFSLFRFMLPKAYFWFAADPPHYWIRYEGPENGPGTPRITMESAD